MSTSSGPKRKITRISEEYGLDQIGDDIADKWHRDDTEQEYTLADLRDHFNKQLLREVMVKAGIDLAPGEVDSTYKYLFEDSVPPSEKQDVKRRLEMEGVDVDSVMDNFINSPQTIHNYLRDVKGAELKRQRDDDNYAEKSLGHIRSFNEKYKKVVRQIVDRLIEQGELQSGDYDISIECVITNKETGKSFEIRDLLRDG